MMLDCCWCWPFHAFHWLLLAKESSMREVSYAFFSFTFSMKLSFNLHSVRYLVINLTRSILCFLILVGNIATLDLQIGNLVGFVRHLLFGINSLMVA